MCLWPARSWRVLRAAAGLLRRPADGRRIKLPPDARRVPGASCVLLRASFVAPADVTCREGFNTCRSVSLDSSETAAEPIYFLFEQRLSLWSLISCHLQHLPSLSFKCFYAGVFMPASTTNLFYIPILYRVSSLYVFLLCLVISCL